MNLVEMGPLGLYSQRIHGRHSCAVEPAWVLEELLRIARWGEIQRLGYGRAKASTLLQGEWCLGYPVRDEGGCGLVAPQRMVQEECICFSEADLPVFQGVVTLLGDSERVTAGYDWQGSLSDETVAGVLPGWIQVGWAIETYSTCTRLKTWLENTPRRHALQPHPKRNRDKGVRYWAGSWT